MKIKLLLLILFIILNAPFMNGQDNDTIIVYSELTLEEALAGLKIPQNIRKTLTIITVKYWGFDNKIHKGQLVINKKLSDEVKQIFNEIFHLRFPIKSVIPIVKFGWNDEKSMLANNTSAFNYRKIKGTERLSNHAFGIAIDINPLLNPYIKKNSVEPEGASYNPKLSGTIAEDSEVVKIFKSHGWNWGGEWKRGKDYQHFEKPAVYSTKN